MKNTIKIERARLDISQEELSKRVDVTRQTIHAIERRKKTPSVELALKIAKVFNQSVEAIFQLENRNKKRLKRRNKK